MDKYKIIILKPDIFDKDFAQKFETIIYSLARVVNKRNTSESIQKLIPAVIQRYKNVFLIIYS